MESNFKIGRTAEKKGPLTIYVVSILLAALALLGGANLLSADPESPQIAPTIAASPQIKADKTVYDVKNASAEFIGNVSITQGVTVTTADNVKIFFNTGESAGLSLDQNSFKKIVASGNVKIVSEEGVAVADEAVYDSADNSLVMTGTPATWDSDAISMSCGEITLYGVL